MLLINKEYAKEFIESIKNTKYNIRGYLYHDSIHSEVNGSIIDDIISELRQAKIRGVDIKILCNSQIQVEKLRRYNIDIKRPNGYKTMHSKAFMFDNDKIFVGSHNMTDNAMLLNLEMSAIINDIDSITRFNNFFNITWQS